MMQAGPFDPLQPQRSVIEPLTEGETALRLIRRDSLVIFACLESLAAAASVPLENAWAWLAETTERPARLTSADRAALHASALNTADPSLFAFALVRCAPFELAALAASASSVLTPSVVSLEHAASSIPPTVDLREIVRLWADESSDGSDARIRAEERSAITAVAPHTAPFLVSARSRRFG